jgi:hypothetical protein
MILKLSEIKIIIRILLDYKKFDQKSNRFFNFSELDEDEFLVLRNLPLNLVFEFLEKYYNYPRKNNFKSPNRTLLITISTNRAFDAMLKLGFVDPVEYLAKKCLVDNVTKDSKSSFAYLMLEYGNAKAIPYLLEMLKDKSRYVKGKAAEALGYVGNQSCIQSLEKCLTDHREDSQGVPISELAAISIRTINRKESGRSSP